VSKITRVGIGVEEWVCSSMAGLSLEEQGIAIREMCLACMRGDSDYVSSLRFVLKVVVQKPGRNSIPAVIRSEVLSAGICSKCGCKEKLTVDHIKPVCEGGGNESENLQCLCWPCNRKKGPESRRGRPNV